MFTLARERLGIVVALELLEVGDSRGAIDVLLAALEDDGPSERPYRCSCGASFEWPGLLHAHEDRSGHHGAALAEAA